MQVARALTQNEVAECLAIRRVEFIDEQGVTEADEIDGLDEICLHYIVRHDNRSVATARVLPMDNIAKIQRVAVLKSHRSAGIGSILMTKIIADLAKHHIFNTLKLGAQLSALPFYQRLGFKAYGPEYDDAGILHRDMIRDL